jgi:hypothetical protein
MIPGLEEALRQKRKQYDSALINGCSDPTELARLADELAIAKMELNRVKQEQETLNGIETEASRANRHERMHGNCGPFENFDALHARLLSVARR